MVFPFLASCSRRVRLDGTLRATEPEFTLRLRSEQGRRRVEGHAGRVVLPAGRYRIEGWSARMRDGRGRVWEVRRAAGEPARVVEVVSGVEKPLPLALPAQPELVIEQSGREVSFRLRLKGSGNETLGEVWVSGLRLPPPALRIEDARGHTLARLPGDESCGAGCARSWRPPRGLVQPLTAIPETDLGPFRLAAVAFRFRLPSAPVPDAAASGRSAPDFALSPAGGAPLLHLSALRGRPVVLGFFCGCGDCQAATKRLVPEAAALGAPLVAVVENERQLQPEQVARFRQVTGFAGPVLADRGGAVTRRYHATGCPRLFALDAAGVIRYTNPDPHTSPEAMARGIRRALGKVRGPIKTGGSAEALPPDR